MNIRVENKRPTVENWVWIPDAKQGQVNFYKYIFIINTVVLSPQRRGFIRFKIMCNQCNNTGIIKYLKMEDNIEMLENNWMRRDVSWEEKEDKTKRRKIRMTWDLNEARKWTGYTRKLNWSVTEIEMKRLRGTE